MFAPELESADIIIYKNRGIKAYSTFTDINSKYMGDMPDIIDKALMSHAVIKRRLCEAINDPGLMRPEEVRSDRTCAFGLWIYGPEAIKEAGRPEFITLRTVHAKFHEAAYEALLNMQSGNSAAAQASIVSGDFEMCSRKMVTALMALKATRPKP